MADRTRDLIKANADLSRTLEEVKRLQEQLRRLQKMGSGGTLAGELADDFNNVLSIVQGYAAAFVDHPADPARAIEVGEVIARTVDQVAALVRRLIAIAGKSEPQLDPADLKIYLPIPKQYAALAEKTKSIEEKKTAGRAKAIETALCGADEPRPFRLLQSFMIGEELAFLTARDGAEAVQVYRRCSDEIALAIVVLGLAKSGG